MHRPQSGGGFLAGRRTMSIARRKRSADGLPGSKPTSSVSLALTALLTVFIALYGIRMLMGHVPS
jgi:hypothetical protein